MLYDRNLTGPTGRTGSTTLQDGKTVADTTALNNPGNGIDDYSSTWHGCNGANDRLTGTCSRQYSPRVLQQVAGRGAEFGR